MLEVKMMLSFIWDVLRLRGCGLLTVVVGLAVVALIIVVGLLFVRL